MIDPFIICFNTADPDVVHGCLAYWELNPEGKWTYPVKAIADFWKMAPNDATHLIAGVAPIFVGSKRCPSCLNPSRAESRTALVEVLRRPASKCLGCRKREQEAVEQRRLVESEEQNKRLEVEKAIIKEIWTRETAPNVAIAYWALGFADVIRAFALYNNSELNDDLEVSLAAIPPFAPTGKESARVIGHLHSLGVLQFGRKTPVEAFTKGDSPGTFQYYPARISWRFAPAAEGGHQSVGMLLASYLDEPTDNEELWEGIGQVWWETARAECSRYLEQQLEEFGLHPNSGKALNDAIEYALEKYSLPQVRNLLYYVARDTAIYSQRVNVVRPQAINSIPGALTRKVDRSLAEGWELKPFFRKWEEEECALITTLFDRVLRSGRQGYGSLSGGTIGERIKQAQSI